MKQKGTFNKSNRELTINGDKLQVLTIDGKDYSFPAEWTPEQCIERYMDTKLLMDKHGDDWHKFDFPFYIDQLKFEQMLSDQSNENNGGK
jgi:hypothetical protein